MGRESWSFTDVAFGEIKPYTRSLKDCRLDLVYYRDPGLNGRVRKTAELTIILVLGQKCLKRGALTNYQHPKLRIQLYRRHVPDACAVRLFKSKCH